MFQIKDSEAGGVGALASFGLLGESSHVSLAPAMFRLMGSKTDNNVFPARTSAMSMLNGRASSPLHLIWLVDRVSRFLCVEPSRSSSKKSNKNKPDFEHCHIRLAGFASALWHRLRFVSRQLVL